MSVETVIESMITTIVAKAAAWEADVANAVDLVEAEVALFFQWLASVMPQVTADVQTVEGLVNQAQAAGVPLPSAVTTGLGALNTAVAGLNAAAAATNAGAKPSQAVLALYTAVKGVSAGAATLSTAAVSAAGPTPSVASAIVPAAT